MAPHASTTLMEQLRRPFAPADLEWRIQRAGVFQDNQGQDAIWATLVPYITARAVMDRLDEVFGPMGWEIRYTPWSAGKPGVVGELRVRDPASGDWITKQDGAEQPKEQGEQLMSVKGGFSAALKRAAVALGIGRSLYGIGDIFADVSTSKQRGWEKSKVQNKKANTTLTYWWRAPEAGIRLACGLGPNDPIDDRTPGPARSPGGQEGSRGAGQARPASDAGQGQGRADAPTPKQVDYLTSLLSSSVFSDDERLAARDELPSLTRKTIAEKIDAVKKELERRKAAAPATTGAGHPRKQDTGFDEFPEALDADDGLPF